MNSLNNNKNPLISIGIPTYNRPDELCHCIKNILSQTYKNIEIIVVDNKSTDPRCEKLYSSKLFNDVRIKLYKNEFNNGVLENAKVTLKYATGKYFCWVSDDDWRSNRFIEELYNNIEKLGSGYIVFSNYREIINNCIISNRHIPKKSVNMDNIFLTSDICIIRQIYYFLSDHSRGKCNFFYSLMPTEEIRKCDFLEASENWKNLSMDRNLVFLLLNRNKIYTNPKILTTLTTKNEKMYLIQKNKNQKYSLSTKVIK